MFHSSYTYVYGTYMLGSVSVAITDINLVCIDKLGPSKLNINLDILIIALSTYVNNRSTLGTKQLLNYVLLYIVSKLARCVNILVCVCFVF